MKTGTGLRLVVESLLSGGYIVRYGDGPPTFASNDLSGVMNFLVEVFEPPAVKVDDAVNTYPRRQMTLSETMEKSVYFNDAMGRN